MSVISAAKFRDQLDHWGVDFVEHTRHDRCLNRTVDWSDHEARRGRDCARRGWDAHGIAIHHSGGPTSWQFVWDGRSDVPGPLYTVLIYPDGIAHLTGFRITNNVGRCDATVRNRVLRGDMPTSGGNVSPGVDDYSAANSEFYGISYRGTAPNAAQRRTALLICAAICSGHGRDWDGGSVAGHKELTRRKPDPEGENMSAFRSDLNKLLAAGPGGGSTPGGTTVAKNSYGDRAVWHDSVFIKATNPDDRMRAYNYLRYIHKYVIDARRDSKRAAALSEQILALLKAQQPLLEAAATGQALNDEQVQQIATAAADAVSAEIADDVVDELVDRLDTDA